MIPVAHASSKERSLREWLLKADLPQVTIRSIIAGLLIGSIVLFSNFQFGLQTGWVSMMSLPSSLLAFALFRTLQHSYSATNNSDRPRFLAFLDTPFTDVENVFVQSLAVAVGTGPLAFGFVGVIPAIEKFLTPEEAGLSPSSSNDPPIFSLFTRRSEQTGDSPISFSLIQLIMWSSALAFFGVFFGVLLRKQIIVKEKLRFPSGSATATMIAVLHQNEISDIHDDYVSPNQYSLEDDYNYDDDDNDPVTQDPGYDSMSNIDTDSEDPNQEIMRPSDTSRLEHLSKKIYSENIRILLFSFAVSASYSLFSYFFPILRNIPLFGKNLAKNYLWTFQPSPAYVGQGIIMGLPTVSAMLFGAILGWAILGPMAQRNGWATGPVDDWKTGAQGWILWVSLAIMVADTVVSFLTITGISLQKAVFRNNSNSNTATTTQNSEGTRLKLKNVFNIIDRFIKAKGSLSFTSSESQQQQQQQQQQHNGYTTLNTEADSFDSSKSLNEDTDSEPDAEPRHIVGISFAVLGLVLSCLYCVVALKLTFLLPTRETLTLPSFHFQMPVIPVIAAVLLALLLAILGVRALGETDLNPVSGIGKISQLIFAVLVPPKTHPAAVLINLVAGGVTEAGAQQAGDLMQDLKTGHLIGASPRAQFIAQVIGSIWSVILSAIVYRLYDTVYKIPGDTFRIPTAVVWIDCARLVTGKGLPPKVSRYAWGFGLVFAFLAMIKTIAPTLVSRYNKNTSESEPEITETPSARAKGKGITRHFSNNSSLLGTTTDFSSSNINNEDSLDITITDAGTSTSHEPSSFNVQVPPEDLVDEYVDTATTAEIPSSSSGHQTLNTINNNLVMPLGGDVLMSASASRWSSSVGEPLGALLLDSTKTAWAFFIRIASHCIFQAAVHARFIPSGVAVGIGIYNTPSFTLARFLGGLFAAYWVRLKNNSDNDATLKLVVLSSGLVLGEGVFSIISLIMTSIGVPHF
ncbi:uncharacterized protein SAPINGB_P000092 [Magnusiomyces paraingens]|uniref:Oligopeptide transporter n=1 Tax=Magnusiomyces paraingens TaxID=2606893 RepID=A0A5E8B228_9ASCO|nr:uncharacterized protein SAPINGB_P000092 [Saprochaete ingens]VVT43672.1 unnamed protein product [Saprochaete ingens]